MRRIVSLHHQTKTTSRRFAQSISMPAEKDQVGRHPKQQNNKRKTKDKMTANGFTFFETYWSALRGLSNARFGIFAKALCDYAFSGNEPQFSDPILETYWALIKPAHDNSLRRRKTGSQGGLNKAAKRSQAAAKTAQTANTKASPLQNGSTQSEAKKDAAEGENGEASANAANGSNATAAHAAQLPVEPFQPPTLKEVQTYCKEQGYTFDADYFYEYYASKGWHVGKSMMQSWKLAAKVWQNKETEFVNHQKKQIVYAQSPISKQDLEERDRQRRYAHYAEFMRASLNGELDPDPNEPLPF